MRSEAKRTQAGEVIAVHISSNAGRQVRTKWVFQEYISFLAPVRVFSLEKEQGKVTFLFVHDFKEIGGCVLIYSF